MNGIHKTIRQVVVLLAMALVAHPVQADDTEIFFADASADNASNRPVANVLFLLDTSGSMRWCKDSEGGYYNSGNPYWCSNPDKRRINMLVDAMNNVLDNVQDGVRIGLGRFNNDTKGGRVLVPVVDVTEDTKKVLREQVNSLNAAGDTSSGGSTGEPRGGTPTATSYSEMTRYMMGMSPYYGSGYHNTAVCVAYKDEEYNCRKEVVGWGEWELIAGTCNEADASCMRVLGDLEETGTPCDVSSDTCDADYGNWKDIGGTCDTSLDTCRISSYGSWQTVASCDTSQDTCRSWWTDWQVTMPSGADSVSCPNIDDGQVEQRRRTSGWGWWITTRCERRELVYQERAAEYQERDVTYYDRSVTYYTRVPIYDEVCDINRVCVEEQKVVGDDGKYISPMDMNNECESNHVVIFTDGEPSSEDMRNWGFVDCSDTNNSYTCQRRISSYLNQRSLFNNSVITNAKKRPVKTYNIGLYMGSNESKMASVSTDGSKGTYSADDADSLLKAFSSVLDLIAEDSRSFASPGVAVNQMNRLQHLDQLYYAVFKPKESSYWDGNLKRYSIEKGEIRGKTGPAVNPDTGYFADDTESYWTEAPDLPDGPDVTKGGARQQAVLEGPRNLVYTDATESMKTLDWANQNSPTFFGLPADATQEEVDLLKERLKTMWGDPLHSEPTLVNYGGSAENNYIFVSNNGGMLHAISSQTGEEKFAFMPHQLISRADEFTVNRPGLGDGNERLLYGLDGSWTAWRRSGDTAISTPKAVYLYGGMRRGGYSYFGLDVSNINSPTLMWQIDRGDSGFGRLGQTWSQPTFLAVKVGGVPTPALVFGGGYSPEDHDEKQGQSRGAGDQMGNMIYVVNALTGNLIWSAGANGAGAKHTTVSSMKWSIPSTVSAVDVDFDGFDDFLYFGDLGGQVFRVDLDDKNVTDSEVHRIASLSGSSASNNRRFFYAPAVGYYQDENSKEEMLYVAIGSGYRAHPLDEAANDYFFVLKDGSALKGQNPSEVLGMADLVQVSSGGEATVADKGWALPLVGDGEKATASPVIFGGRIFFTSYEPGVKGAGIDTCEVRIGTSYLYVADLVTAAAAAINDGDAPQRKRELKQDVPPPTPTLISDGENTLLVVGTEIVGGDEIDDVGVRRGSWYQLAPADADKVPLP